MRRRTILAARTLVVLALVAAVLDLPVPASSSARRRIHLVDRSGSVLVPGSAESLTPRDAAAVIAWDHQNAAPSDTTLSASFGGDVAFESTEVGPDHTRLAEAVEAALARDPTEIVLYTDGRADAGRAILMCQARDVPVHVFPIGPASVHDARISTVSASTTSIEATVEASFPGSVRVILDNDARDIAVTAGVPAVVTFPGRAGPFHLRIETENDACPRNNEVRGDILVSSELRKVMVLTNVPLPIEGYDARTPARFENPQPYDAVVLDNVPLSPEEQKALASYVRDFGGNLILMGGPKSYALGGWERTPIDEISPLRAVPDHRVAVVFAVDRSGSMEPTGKLDAVLRAVQEARAFFEPGDDAVVLAFSNDREFVAFEALPRLRASGATHVAAALEEARRHLAQSSAARKQIILLTDGETASDEKPEERCAAAAALARDGIALTVVTTNREIEAGTHVRIADWKALQGNLLRLLQGVRQVELKNPGTLDPKDHPVTRDAPHVEIPWMNLTTARPDAQVAATVGRPPVVYPAVAFRQAGRGRVGAFAFRPEGRLLLKSLEYIIGDTAGGLSLSIDPPTIRARGSGPARIEAAYQWISGGDSGIVSLDQVGTGLWEGSLPDLREGTVFVRAGRAGAAATVPCLPEYKKLGVDRAALEAIASGTGGRILRSSQDLKDIPLPARPARRPGRPLFLTAAIALFLLDAALSTFWKP